MKKEGNKNCGIYKITSPTGKIYIGQSTDLKKRENQYKKLHCKQQIHLYNSVKKYGWENHQFDVIEYCSEEELNCSERFWQDVFEVMGKKGLNCKLTKCGDKRLICSEDTKKKMSKNNHLKGTRGKLKNSIEVIDISTGVIYKSIREGASLLNLCHKVLSDKLRGTVDNTTTLMYLENYLKGESINRKENKKYIKIIDISTGVIYKTIKEAADANNINEATLGDYIKGRYKNKTNLRRYEG